MVGQLAFEDTEGYESEHLIGATAAPFPVILTPTTVGCMVEAPPYVEYAVRDQEDGTVVVALRFPKS